MRVHRELQLTAVIKYNYLAFIKKKYEAKTLIFNLVAFL